MDAAEIKNLIAGAQVSQAEKDAVLKILDDPAATPDQKGEALSKFFDSAYDALYTKLVEADTKVAEEGERKLDELEAKLDTDMDALEKEAAAVKP